MASKRNRLKGMFKKIISIDFVVAKSTIWESKDGCTNYTYIISNVSAHKFKHLQWDKYKGMRSRVFRTVFGKQYRYIKNISAERNFRWCVIVKVSPGMFEKITGKQYDGFDKTIKIEQTYYALKR